MCILPEIPKDFPYVCVMFFKCSANIDYMFDEMHEKDDEANNNPAIIFMHINRWLNNVCNPFMTHLLISLKLFFMPFIPDEYLQVEKIFGRYQSKRIRQKQRILSGGRTFISSPYSNFLYEMSLYADIPVSKIVKLFCDDCKYLFSLCDHVYRRFRKRFRKNCKKSGLATYITGQNLP